MASEGSLDEFGSSGRLARVRLILGPAEQKRDFMGDRFGQLASQPAPVTRRELRRELLPLTPIGQDDELLFSRSPPPSILSSVDPPARPPTMTATTPTLAQRDRLHNEIVLCTSTPRATGAPLGHLTRCRA